MAEARERLAVAKATLASGFPNAVVNPAYYAMLYAARAALSEEDRYAKTHSGTWNLFRETFVATRRFDSALLTAASDMQKMRIGADYEARQIDTPAAAAAIDLAERFLAAIEALYPD